MPFYLNIIIVENFILIIALILIGMFLKRLRVFPEKTSETLNLFVIYVSLPALVMLKVPLLTFSDQLLAAVITPWIMLVFSATLVLILAKKFNWQRDVLGALLLVVPMGNTAFLGLPLVESFFGESAVIYALMYDQFGSFFIFSIYGSIILALFSPQKEHISVQAIIKKILLFPPFICLMIALLLTQVNLPQSYFDFLSPIATTLIPVVMIALGFQLQLKLSASQLTPLFSGLAIKMIFAPAIAFGIFSLMSSEGLVYDVAVFQAAMPPMISAGALAIMANLAPRLTAAIVAYGILLCFITLPLWSYFLHNV